jgi:hypothetical protein
MITKRNPKGAYLSFLAGILLIFCLQGCRLLGSDSKKDPIQPVSHGFYTISYPFEGAQFDLDSTYTLEWVTSDSVASGAVVISLYQGEKRVIPQIAYIENLGTYKWSLPYTRNYGNYLFGSGLGYRLKMTSVDDTNQWDFSPTFNVYSKYKGSLTVVSPVATTVAHLDSALSVRWTSTGEMGTSVGIQLYKDTMQLNSRWTAISSNGSYSIPRLYSSYGSGSDFHIRIFSTSDPAITSLSPAFRILSDYYGSYLITSPKARDTLVSGNSTSVTWTTKGNPGDYANLVLYSDTIPIESINGVYQSDGKTFIWMVPTGLTSGSRYRMRLTSGNDPAISSYSDYFVIAGTDPDEYENDDSLKLATPITTDGKPQSHTASYMDRDYLRFNATAGKRYLVSVQGKASSTGGSNTTVSAAWMDSLGRNQTGSLSGSKFQMILTAAYTGKYHLVVYGYSESGSYTIALTEYDASSTLLDLTFASPDEKTTWAAGSSYSIAWTPDTTLYGSWLELFLYNDTTFVQSITSQVSNLGSYSWLIPNGLTTSDTYRIRISSYANLDLYSYSPKFTISGLTPDTYEPDNVNTAAKTLTEEGAAQIHSLTSSDYDWFRINAKKGTKYLVTISSPISVTGYLYDSASRQLNSQSGTSFSMAITPTYTGSHFIRMQPSYGLYGNYTIALISYDSTQVGFPVKFTNPDSNSIWAAGSYYAIKWVPDLALFGTYVSLSLYLEETLVSSIAYDISNSMGTYSWTLPLGLLTSGKYHIRIQNYNNPQIIGSSPNFTISGLAPDAFEPDNARGSAKPITVDGVAQAHSSTLSDTDWVKFDAVTTQTYIVSLNSAYNQYLTITDSLGSSLVTQTGTKIAAVLNPIRSGKYYVKIVSASSSANGDYSLAVLAYDGGPSGIPAKFITPDSTTTWAAGSYYLTTWTPDTVLFGKYISLALYRDNIFIQSLASSANNVGSTSVTLPLGLASATNYQIRMTNYQNTQIFGQSQKFSISGLTPDIYEPNDSASKASIIAANSAKQTLSLTAKDIDWFRFSAKANLLYVIQATTPSSLPTTIQVYSGQGTSSLQISSKTTSDTLNSLSWVCPAAGIYYFSIAPYQSSSTYSGSYGFEFKELEASSYKFVITAPIEKDTIKLNQNRSITWTDPSSSLGTVDIFLYNADGVVQTIIANRTNNGSYIWLVPATLAARSDYYIKVMNHANSAISGVSGAFSIEP